MGSEEFAGFFRLLVAVCKRGRGDGGAQQAARHDYAERAKAGTEPMDLRLTVYCNTTPHLEQNLGLICLPR